MSTGGRGLAFPQSWLTVLIVAWAIAAWGCSTVRSVHVVTLRDPLSPQEHVALGVAYEREGKQDLAKAEYENALRAQPDDAQALVNLGNLAAHEGAFDDAEGWYRRAVRVGGKEAAPGANNLAWLYLTQDKRLASAESLARKAIAWDPKPDYVDTLVDILIKAGKPVEAGRAIDDAIALSGDDPQQAEQVRRCSRTRRRRWPIWRSSRERPSSRRGNTTTRSSCSGRRSGETVNGPRSTWCPSPRRC
jgi:Flp pilus assembly protein TadD